MNCTRRLSVRQKDASLARTRRRGAAVPGPERWLVIVALIGALAILSCDGGDGPSAPSVSNDPIYAGLTMSEPIRGEAGGTAAYSYVSAQPGTFPAGRVVHISNTRSGDLAITSMVDGGFDPHGILAFVGDRVEIEIRSDDGTVRTVPVTVPDRRAPRAVRTWPQPARTDWPTDGPVGALFSEPLDANSISSAIGLRRGAEAVAGTVTLSSDGLRAEFLPLEPLVAGSEYELVIDTGVQDLSGDSLEVEIEVNFATAGPAGMVPDTLGRLISAGVHTCRIIQGGQAYCWGWNDLGQLGAESGENCGGDVPCSTTPLAVAGDLRFVQISAYSYHTCGIATGGEAYCWGHNDFGQVGDGTTTDRATPALVSDALSFASISVGRFHTCAITDIGYAYCWGLDTSGALGVDGGASETCTDSQGASVPCSTQPLPVTGGLTFESISAGRDFTCGIASRGVGYCWGNNEGGKLGIGTLEQDLPSVPHTLAGGHAFVAISAGAAHACGITTEGAGYCWGQNMTGAIGGPNGGATPVLVSGGHTFVSLDAGGNHTCGVTIEGQAYCWGQGWRGVLGDGSTEVHIERTPVPVYGDVSFTTVTAGQHTCALTPLGATYCWGSNRYGQIGDGTTVDRSTPVLILGMSQ